jgi:hypothetical protein
MIRSDDGRRIKKAICNTCHVEKALEDFPIIHIDKWVSNGIDEETIQKARKTYHDGR